MNKKSRLLKNDMIYQTSKEKENSQHLIDTATSNMEQLNRDITSTQDSIKENQEKIEMLKKRLTSLEEERKKMIVFVGSSQHGFFIEDVARKLSLPYEYIAPASRINLQQQSIFDSIQKGGTHILYDIDQYDMSPFEIADAILHIEEATQVQSIIYAPGYLPDAKALCALQQRGISYFITQTILSDQKDMLESYLSGTYQPAVTQDQSNDHSPNHGFKKPNISLLALLDLCIALELLHTPYSLLNI